MLAPILRAEQVVKELIGPQEPVLAVDGVDLTIQRGEFVAIIGPSGSGKSTLLYMLGALDRPTRGEVYLDGVSTRSLPEKKLAALRNDKVGFVFQFHFLLPELTALDNVAMPMMVGGAKLAEARKRAAELLEKVELSHRAEHRPHELSGGQQQRVAIARALANNPLVLLGDELTGNLDTKNGELVYGWLRQQNRDLGQTIVIVTHNEDLAAHADRVIELVDGRISTTSGEPAKPVLPPPWVQFPGQEPEWGGWRQGNGEGWAEHVWLPYWRSLDAAERDAYLQRWTAPDTWRDHLLKGFWQ